VEIGTELAASPFTHMCAASPAARRWALRAISRFLPVVKWYRYLTQPRRNRRMRWRRGVTVRAATGVRNISFRERGGRRGDARAAQNGRGARRFSRTQAAATQMPRRFYPSAPSAISVRSGFDFYFVFLCVSARLCGEYSSGCGPAALSLCGEHCFGCGRPALRRFRAIRNTTIARPGGWLATVRSRE
jgi:hypothetical protein